MQQPTFSRPAEEEVQNSETAARAQLFLSWRTSPNPKANRHLFRPFAGTLIPQGCRTSYIQTHLEVRAVSVDSTQRVLPNLVPISSGGPKEER